MSIVSFKVCVSLLIFYLVDLAIGVSGAIKSPTIIACWSPAPAARESAWMREWCRRTMMSPLTQSTELHVYFKLQVFFYTLTKALGQSLTFLVSPNQIYCLQKSLLSYKQSSCFSDSFRIRFTIYYLLSLMCPILNLWFHCNSCHIPQFISYLPKSCLPLAS